MERIESSISSVSISSSELDDEDPEYSMFTLPSELDGGGLSPPGLEAQAVGRSPPNWLFLLLPGMFIARPVIVGLESGLEWSANVEWCRLVAALEKSRPRDLRGITGEPYVSAASSFGERGMRLAAPRLKISFDGIFNERFRIGQAGRRGVDGLSRSMESSFKTCAGSRNLGEGERDGPVVSPPVVGLDGEGNCVL